MENYNYFASLSYSISDGLIASYFPDFKVRIGDYVYLLETRIRKTWIMRMLKAKSKLQGIGLIRLIL